MPGCEGAFEQNVKGGERVSWYTFWGGRANEVEGMASVKVLRPEQARPLQERGRGGRGWRGESNAKRSS